MEAKICCLTVERWIKKNVESLEKKRRSGQVSDGKAGPDKSHSRMRIRDEKRWGWGEESGEGDEGKKGEGPMVPFETRVAPENVDH